MMLVEVWRLHPHKGNNKYKNKKWLYEQYIIRRQTQRQVAKLCGADHKTIRYWLKKFNISIRNHSEAQMGKYNPIWKGGIRKPPKQKYIFIYNPNHPNALSHGYVPLHRHIMSKTLNRPLKPWEEVHHIDRNPRNNKLQNLQLFNSRKEHLMKGHNGSWNN